MEKNAASKGRIDFMVIGISGRMHAGKNAIATIVEQLATEIGICSDCRGFGDSVKEECAAMAEKYFGIPYDQALREMHSSDPKVKEHWRLLMQWWGTEGRRNLTGSEYWVNRMRTFLSNKCQPNMIVTIPDVRFYNEVRLIKSFPNALMIKVERPGEELVSDHSSENELALYDAFDVTIVNDGSLDDLHQKIKPIFMHLCMKAMTNEAGNSSDLCRSAL